MPEATTSPTTSAAGSTAGGAEEVARSYFAALAARDADAMAAHWSFEGVDDLDSVGVFRGPDEIRELFRGIFDAVPDLDAVVERVTASDRVAAVQWRISGTHTGGPLFGIEATGRFVALRGCDCVEVEDGTIVRNTAYMDGSALARAQGLLPPAGSGAERTMIAAFNAANRIRRAVGERLGG